MLVRHNVRSMSESFGRMNQEHMLMHYSYTHICFVPIGNSGIKKLS